MIFGRTFPEVHKWIDGKFDGTNGRTHWIHRHHLKAINEEYPLQPEDTLENMVARVHVIVDWLYYYKRIVFPESREDVIRELETEGFHTEQT